MLHKPSVAMLDECTSAVDEHQQNLFYKLLRDQGMCFVSVGHRPELQRLHDKVQSFSSVVSLNTPLRAIIILGSLF
jgi:putative ATP-binding cassette transporter